MRSTAVVALFAVLEVRCRAWDTPMSCAQTAVPKNAVEQHRRLSYCHPVHKSSMRLLGGYLVSCGAVMQDRHRLTATPAPVLVTLVSLQSTCVLCPLDFALGRSLNPLTRQPSALQWLQTAVPQHVHGDVGPRALCECIPHDDAEGQCWEWLAVQCTAQHSPSTPAWSDDVCMCD